MKIAIFTRTGFHHTSFINRLQERFDVACVVREAYPEIRDENNFVVAAKNIFRQNGLQRIRDILYLKQFHAQYSAGFRFHRLLKDYLRTPFDLVVERPGAKYLNARCGEVNSEALVSYIKGIRPDIIAVLGSSVIKTPMISVPSGGMLNLHSGLSPYYRGTWSYGWPVVNEEPEYIGATVHYINPGIDTGDIIYQSRPGLGPEDDLNTIFLKVIAEGIELMADAIEGLAAGSLTSYRQPPDAGRLYRLKDFNADVARRCLLNLEGGIIGKSLKNKADADSKVKLYGAVAPRLFR